MKLCTILTKFKIMIFGKFWWWNLKNVGTQNLLQNDEIQLFFSEFHCDFNFLVKTFWKNVTFFTKSWFSGLTILWSSCHIRVTSWMSFSQPNNRHTFSSFTIRKVTLPWYDFVKESSPNLSYRSRKHRNEIATQKFDEKF